MQSIRMAYTIFLSFLVMVAAMVSAQAADPSGLWLSQQEDGDRQAHIRVSRCGPTLCNEIVWLSRPTAADGGPLRDVRNHNPRLRNRPILGLTVLLGMREGKDGRWYGKVYSPERGRVYKGHLTMLSDNRLKVTGCQKVGFIPVCKSRIWTRVGQ